MNRIYSRISTQSRTTPVTLFEHEERDYASLGLHAGHEIIDLLEKINESSGGNIFQLGRHSLKASSHVGVVQVGDWTFQILPKIDYGDQSDNSDFSHQSAASNLIVLLSYAYDLKIYEQAQASQATLQADWFELLTYLFAADLHRQVQNGIYQTYKQVDHQQPVLRGRWNLHRQFLVPSHNRFQFDVSYDEYSPDNPLNQVFRFVISRLRWLSRDPLNQRLLADLADWLNGVTPLMTVPSELLSQIVFTRLNQQYEPAYKLARLFLDHEVIQTTVGKQNLYAFLFDMNRLFELFLSRFLQQHQSQILPPCWHNAQIRFQSAGQPTYLAEQIPEQKQYFLLKPDILINHPLNKTPLLIIDTKYKRLGHQRLNVSEGDVYQMLAYATRHNCRRVVLLYPQTAEMKYPIRQTFQIIDTNIQIQIATINLRIPLDHKESLVAEFKSILYDSSIGIQGGNDAQV